MVITNPLNRRLYKKLSLALLVVSLVSGCSTSPKNDDGAKVPPRQIEYSYAQLQLRDSEEMKRLIAKRMNDGDALLVRDPNDS